MTKKKRLKHRPPESGRRLLVRESLEPNWQAERPVFSFHYMVRGYCIEDCLEQEKSALADALWRRSQLSWLALGQAAHHALGYEKIKQDAIKTPIPPHVTPDMTLIAFRYNGLKPMIGYRERDVFHILWVDPHLEVYDHS